MSTTLVATILIFSLFGGRQQEKPTPQEKPASTDTASCPMHEKHQATEQNEHHQGVVDRGDHAMGFSDEKTTHRFRLYADGGAIEVEAKDPKDTDSSDAIRGHLTHIVKMFGAGDFSIPMLIHAQDPPGAETMKRLRDAIEYKVENTERGGRIRITTKNAEALLAIHSFLRFQISDHQTGDSVQISSER
jgi:hypothetical protein